MFFPFFLLPIPQTVIITWMSSSKKGSSTPNVPGSAAAASRPSLLKLFINTGQASPSPPVGPALGQKGIKAMDFCKQFNEQSTRQYLPGIPLRCHITCMPDRTFTFQIRPPTTTFLLKRAAGIEKASSMHTVAEMSVKYVYELAKMKRQEDVELKRVPLKRVFYMMMASARTCGFKIF